MDKKTILRIIFICIVFIIINLFYKNIRAMDVKEFIQNERQHISFFLVLLLFLAKSIFFFIPSYLLFFVAGMIFNIFVAVFLCVMGIFIEISAGYFYGYFLGNEYVQKLINKYDKFKKLMNFDISNYFRAIIFLRIIPVGIEPVSLLMGGSGYNFWLFIFASFIGILPKIIIFASIGNSFLYPMSPQVIAMFVFALVFWITSFIVLKKVVAD
ncbi:MAG: TVP38/TMEM64 family protein [Bacillota bacterium]